MSVDPIYSTTVDFSGHEYFTARGEIRGNEDASALEIEDPVYQPSANALNSGWLFSDDGEFVDEGARYLASKVGNAWTIRLRGDEHRRTVRIYVTVNQYTRGSTENLVSAGEAAERIVKTDQYRSHYVITVTFVGEVEVRMETTASHSDRASF